MTPDRLRELRRIAEAGPAGDWDMIELEHSTVLALLDEIERLRRERETLAEAVRAREALMQASKRAVEDEDAISEIDFAGLVRESMDAHKAALALLDGEEGGDGNE